MRLFSGLALLAALCVTAIPANAASTTYNIDVTATGRVTASANYTLTFDPTLTYNNSTAGLTLNSYSGFDPTSSSGFTYSPMDHVVEIGGMLDGVDLTSASSPDYRIDIANFTTTPTFSDFQTTNADTDIGTVLVTAATPEPTSLLFLGTGALGAIGVLRRRLF